MSSMTVKISSLFQRERLLFVLTACQKAIYDEIINAGLDLVDATCPFVRKIHKIVERESGDGRVIIIIGNNHHPEVEGIMGWCHTHPIVIENREQAEGIELDADTKIPIVSQTTFNYNKISRF